MKIRERLSSIFPISINHYGVGVTVLSLIVFVGFAWYALLKVNDLNTEMNSKNSFLAKKELQQAIKQTITSAGNLSEKFAVWDETIQQLHNPTYYNYWRSNRAKEAAFVPDYFLGIELYNKSGAPLTKNHHFPLLPSINSSKLGALFTKRNNEPVLYYSSQISLRDTSNTPAGYVVVELNFNRLLNKIQKFKQLDYASLNISLNGSDLVTAEQLYPYFKYKTVSNSEYDSLKILMTNTLLQFVVINIVTILCFLFIIFKLMGKPLAVLSLHIDALSSGKHDLLGSNCSSFYLVMEFSKLRHSLNDYLRQLEKLEKIASGDMGEIIDPEAEPEAGGLMNSFNKVYKQLNETIFEKDNVTLQLRNQAEELRKVGDQALAANKAKSNFLANMSHEIRTPLTAIIGFAEASLDSDQTMSERMDALNTIIRSGRHLLQIINDILDLSKVEANKLDIEKILTSPFQIAYEVESLSKLQAANKDVNFAVNYVLPLPLQIFSDPVRVKQVILNLCNNAIKFTKTGHVYLNVMSDSLEKKIIFEVVDTGIGLTEKQIDKLFKPFTQADTSTTRKYGGTGLGLSLSKKLTEMLGGQLSVKSQLNVGSKFTVAFDTGDIETSYFIHHENQLPDVNKEHQSSKMFHPLRGHILVADDVPENQKLISIYLNKLGLTSTVVDNGQSAVNSARQGEYDLILMDMQMPVMDGLQATTILREAGLKLPIVALTANAFKEDKERCLAAGYDNFLVKPINRQQFYEVLSTYLSPGIDKQVNVTPIMSTLLEDSVEYNDLILQHIETLPDTFSSIESAIEKEDWAQLGFILHDIKGTSGNMGFPDMVLTSANMELQLADENYLDFGVGLNLLKNLHQRMIAGYEHSLNSPELTG